MCGTDEIAADSWDFICKLYLESGVSNACLKLQADAGVDVVMLLMGVYASVRKCIHLTDKDVQEMDELCRPWREEVIQPLRTLRTRMKSGPPPAPSPRTEAIRSRIKSSELAAEQLQSEVLASWLRTRSPENNALTRDQIADVMRRLVKFALGESGAMKLGNLIPEIDVILDAVAPAPRPLNFGDSGRG